MYVSAFVATSYPVLIILRRMHATYHAQFWHILCVLDQLRLFFCHPKLHMEDPGHHADRLLGTNVATRLDCR